MNYIGAIVEHEKFGYGKLIKVNDEYIDILFVFGQERRLPYPNNSIKFVSKNAGEKVLSKMDEEKQLTYEKDIVEKERLEKNLFARIKRNNEKKIIAEKKRIEKERIKIECIEERIKKFIAEKERIEKNLFAKRKRIAMKERIEKERIERERIEDERHIAESKRIAEQERIKKERIKKERIEDERYIAESKRIAEQERIKKERIKKERIDEEAEEIEEIEEILTKRKIQYLVHFTRIDNLNSILKNGLVPVGLQQEKNILSKHNDERRMDKRLDCTSCSVGFPNYKLFYVFRESKYPGTKWVTIVIDKGILSSQTNIKYYCYTNASAVLPKTTYIEELCKANSFEKMFRELLETKDNKTINRTSLQIQDCFTTDPQAEILISDVIEPKYIKGICFQNQKDIDDFKKTNGPTLINQYKHKVFTKYFDKRKDYMSWKKE